MLVETVRIASEASEDNPAGFIVINKSDLRPDHVLFEAADEAEQSDKPTRRRAARKGED